MVTSHMTASISETSQLRSFEQIIGSISYEELDAPGHRAQRIGEKLCQVQLTDRANAVQHSTVRNRSNMNLLSFPLIIKFVPDTGS